ncbi:MAG: sulfatase-like hydrolase/transferase [Prosthecobacter sp.]|uniref:sulfatase-like hydrolase/transferase n=1 Tax=Prosthecobacter sp. TaxID=1965333 RepID=UPI0039024DC7
MKAFLAPLLIAASSFIANAGEQRPNIVLIMADDLSHRNLGCYGAVNFETPNLDKLAASGMRFENCFSMPLCTPSRVALMTGQHNGRNFFRASTLEADQRTFGDVAKEAGYATCVVGKWKLTGKSKESTPEQFGFDEHCVTEGLRNDSPRYKNPDILRNGKVEKYSGGEYGPDIVCDHAVDFIERSKDKPFLLYYPMVLVHAPLSPVPGSPGYAAADQRTDDKANYPNMVRRMDANVGRIVAKLDEMGLRERTLILFTGDNGSKNSVEMKLKDGTVYHGGKGNTSDTGVHVPLIVNQPGRVPVGVSDALVSFTDFLPTVADIAGAKLTNDIPCDGQSFLPHCLGKKDAASREWIYEWFCNNPQEDKVIEFTFDRDFRLYDDGRFYHWSADLAEEKPLDLASLDGAAKTAHAKLQSAMQTSRAGLNREKPKKSTAAAAGLSAGGMEFVRVEKGGAVSNDFWMTKHEVTQEIYQATMSENPSTQKAEGHPVETVSWHNAMEFCRRLTDSLRSSQSLPEGHEVRLPISSEWEWAALGGTQSQGHAFAGGSDAKEVGWTKEDSSDGHHSVGAKQPNELGLYDMTGNVWEWCLDQLPADKTGKPGADTRIKRGGSFYNNAATSPITNIGEMAPSGKGPRFGFRVVIAKPFKQSTASTAQSTPAAETRPNILFIAIDDLRPEIGAYGVNRAVTPNIDKLAAKSVRFDRAYVTYPLCLPSRSSMLTGRRIDFSGAGKKRDFGTLIQLQQTWPATLRKAGYWTATSGKLYHGSVPKVDTAAWDVPGEMWRNDFKDWSPELMKKVVAEAGPKDVVEDFRKNGGGSGSLLSMAVDGDDDILTDGQTASIVTGYLRDRPKDKPFVICAGFSRPHMPWIAPKKYFDLYKDAKIELPKLPEGAKRELFKEDLGSGVAKDSAKWNEGVTDDDARELIKGYLASVSYSDAQVGRILAELEKSGRADNTIVILWGDHGYHLTEHGLWRKNTIYHVANRIPLLIHAPGKAAGVCPGLVESIDLYPTLLALTGTSADGLRLDGRSLVPLLDKPDAAWPHPAFIHANKDHGMVTDQYRYSISNNGTEKLFDLHADPDEWQNLAADPAHADRIKQMRTAVEKAWKGDIVTDAPPAETKAKGKAKKKQ